jgi:hypothetical protein
MNIRLSGVFEVYNGILKEMSSFSLIFKFALEYPIGENPEVPGGLELSSLNLVILVYAG